MTVFLALCAFFLAAAIGLLAWPLAGSHKRHAAIPRAWTAAIVIATALPVASFLIYFQASNWDWHAPQEAPGISAPDLRKAVAQIQEKLARQPDDVESWKLLGRSATVLGDYPLAQKAFGEAYTRTQGRDAEAVVGYAESLVLIDEQAIDGQASGLFERALELEPENPRALWYGGITAYRRGDMALAQQRWVELQQHELPPDLRQVLAERLAEIEAALGPAAPLAELPTAIEIAIDIAPSLVAQVPPNATLFVLARRGEGGPPIAVQRRPVGTWPAAARLSDADAMLPGIKLSGGGPLKLVARISKSGQPIAARGDLFGEVGYDSASAHPASITIDRIVP